MKKLLLAAGLLLSLQLTAQNEATFYTNQGNFVVELYSWRMPITSGNFQGLVQSKFYDSIIFHRIISNFIIQGGDPTTRGGSASPVIQDEFDATTSNLKYTISMANSGPNSGTSQFFINLKDNTFLDFDKSPFTSKHPVFGEVTSGFTVVDAIGLVATDGNDKPLTDIRMDSVRMTYVTPAAIEDIAKKNTGINISPNPVALNSMFTLSTGKTMNAKVSVHSMTGQQLYSENLLLNKAGTSLSLEDMNIKVVGLYNIQIESEDFSSAQKLLVR